MLQGAIVRLIPLQGGVTPYLLEWQRKRDEEGGGVSVRTMAEAELAKHWNEPGLARCRAKTQLLTLIDRCLTDERRCDAYTAALDEVLQRGTRRIVVLGMGSLLPAIRAAQAGAHVAVVEASPPLAAIVRAAAAENRVSLAVVPQLSVVARAWGAATDAILTESIDEGLLSAGVAQQLSDAVRTLGGGGDSSDGGIAILPRSADVEAVAVQLGFEGCGGFGLDGLDIDLRYFDALRPQGFMAERPPG
jgi:hypothetical protein